MAGTAARPNEDRPMIGIILMLMTYFIFSCVDASAKWVVLAGVPAIQVAFMRYFGHFVISVALVAREGGALARFGTARPGLVMLRSFMLAGSTILNFVALRYLPLTLTSTIMLSAPIIICALSGPVLGEKVGIWRWTAIIIGFAGILMAMRPFDAGFHWAAFLSLTNAFAFAIYSLITRKLAGEVSSGTMQLYSGMTGTLFIAPFALYWWQNPSTLLDWMLMTGTGILGWFSHEMMTRAHGYAPASALTPFSYFIIIYMGLWGFMVFGAIPDQWTVAGAVIIIGSGLLIWLRERWLARHSPSHQSVH